MFNLVEQRLKRIEALLELSVIRHPDQRNNINSSSKNIVSRTRNRDSKNIQDSFLKSHFIKATVKMKLERLMYIRMEATWPQRVKQNKT